MSQPVRVQIRIEFNRGPRLANMTEVEVVDEALDVLPDELLAASGIPTSVLAGVAGRPRYESTVRWARENPDAVDKRRLVRALSTCEDLVDYGEVRWVEFDETPATLAELVDAAARTVIAGLVDAKVKLGDVTLSAVIVQWDHRGHRGIPISVT